MKITHHIATGQYEFVEVEYDMDNESSIVAEAIRANESEIRRAIVPQGGLPDKEWRDFLDNMLLGESNHIEDFEKCNDEQRKIINEVKKALKRLEAREKRNETSDE